MDGKWRGSMRWLALILLPGSIAAVPATGATVQVIAETSGTFRRDFSPATWTSDGAGGALIEPGQGIVFSQINFSMMIDDLAGPPGEVGFGNVVFDLEFSGAASDFLGIGWMIPPRCEGENCPPPMPPTWADNSDMGIPGDLIDVVVGVAPRSFGPVGEDRRRTLGQDQPELMGSILAAIDSDVFGDKGRVEALVRAHSTYDEDLLLARNDGPAIGRAVVLRIVPEPGTVGMAMLGAVFLVAIVRTNRAGRRREKTPGRSGLVGGTVVVLVAVGPFSSGVFDTDARGASVHVTPSVGTVLLSDFATPAVWSADGSDGALIEPGQGVVAVQIDFFMEIHDLAGPPDEVGFGNVVFNVEITGGASNAFGWIGDTNPSNHCGFPLPIPCVPKWADNGDLGIPGDLIDIVVGVAPGAFGPLGVDPRRMLGQSGPEFMGAVFANFDTGIAGNHGAAEAVVTAFSTYDEELLLARNHGPDFGGSVSLTVVPEPAAASLMLLALAWLTARRRR